MCHKIVQIHGKQHVDTTVLCQCYFTTSEQHSPYLCSWSDLTEWKELFTNHSNIQRYISQVYLKECAILNTMHLHLSTMRWKQTWRLPISLCATICPATVTCCSAVLYLLHLQQIELETTIFIKTEHPEKAAHSCRLTEAWVCWSQFIVEHREGPLESQVKIAVLKGDLCLRIFSLMFYFPNFMKYKQK